ncbi:unnamed protein product [Prunus brigantina]
MTSTGADELVVQLEESLGLSNLKHGPKLVGAIIADNMPNLMKQCFFIKRWPSELAIEEVDMMNLPFWVQIRSIPLNLCMEDNVEKLGNKIGEVLQYDNPNQARGYLRVRVLVNTRNHLPPGF